MRPMLLIALSICISAFSAEANPSAEKPASAPAAHAAATTADDLQNLVACARLQLPSLTAEQLAVVVVAIKHAEDDAKAMRAAIAALPPPPAEGKKSESHGTHRRTNPG